MQELKNFSDQSHEVLSDLKLQYEQTVIDFQKELKLCTENGAKMKQHILKYNNISPMCLEYFRG